VQTEPLHPESLLNIPLVAQLFGDDSVSIQVRGVDARWSYADVVERRIDGFNPFHESIYTGRHSHMADWLPHRGGSARSFNHQDRLVSEVLFAVHDYLHIWAYRWIAHLWKDLGFGVREIDSGNFEDMVFCHLLSEAAATVGLDYWYLSCIDLNDVVPIGSARKGLTISYRESQRSEYRRFDGAFNAQDPSFFGLIASFYCSGNFPGFSASDMLCSPVLRQWLLHELEYGRLQRRYCREWFAYLSNGRVRITGAALDKPVAHDSPRHQKLIRELGELLWTKVKHPEPVDSGYRFDRQRLWSSDTNRLQLFQFLNLNGTEVPKPLQAHRLNARSRTYLLHQFFAQLDYARFPKDAVPVFDFLYRKGDLALAAALLNSFHRISPGSQEPRDLFLYN
jgi:hypothetical protein